MFFDMKGLTLNLSSMLFICLDIFLAKGANYPTLTLMRQWKPTWTEFSTEFDSYETFYPKSCCEILISVGSHEGVF